MKLLNRFFITTILFVLLFGLFSPIVTASVNDKAKYRMKDEVVYATLSATGKNESAHIVNAFEVTKAGTIVDYGEYEFVKNMTDLQDIIHENERVTFKAEKGKFYYQGDMSHVTLPWDFTVRYTLDGQTKSPDELLGKDGKVEIAIESKANQSVDSTFFNHYMLQISFTFDVERFSNIKAEDATIANAGKMEQVTFTVLPEQDANLTVTADVVDFAMESIDITGIPFNMAIEEFDTDEMVDDMGQLSDAIAEIHDGVGELNDGVRKLTDGTGDLNGGSIEFYNGLTEVNNASVSLVNGSQQINDALQQMEQQLGEIPDFDFNEFEQLMIGLDEISSNLVQIADGLIELKENYQLVVKQLDGAIDAIPSPVIQLNDKEVEMLRQSGVDKEKVMHILATYEAAQYVKGLYTDPRVKVLFASIESTLEETSNGLLQIASVIDQMNEELGQSVAAFESFDQIDQLIEGLEQFATHYTEFHHGLMNYTNGVGELTNAYGELHGGIRELHLGTDELSTGTEQLHDGTKTLVSETANLPAEMQEEIDEFLQTYDHTDFTPVSFISDKNKQIGLVQFVIKTAEIKQDEAEDAIENNEETKGFWQMIKNLFIRN